MIKKLVIATRQSPLALWQAEHVKARLEALHPGLVVELLGMVTQGDKMLDSPLAKIGGKGLFVKELERAMLDGRADIAVHSMKDVPMELPEGLALEVICEREEPWDCLISKAGDSIEALPKGAVVGTCSLRRQCQLRNARPDLEVKDLRGNINTRLAKFEAGEYDAIILAAAGMMRMGFGDKITALLSKEASLPAVGQGALGIECRAEDSAVHQLIAPLNCQLAQCRVTAERAMNYRLMGGCQVPIAGYAEYVASEEGASQMLLQGLVGSVDGGTLYRAAAALTLSADHEENLKAAHQVGCTVAQSLLAQGAESILSALRAGTS